MKTFDPVQFNISTFRRKVCAFNRELQRIRGSEGLAAALDALMAQQIDAGFVQDPLTRVIRYRLTDSANPGRYFVAQFNPGRELRHLGSGRSASRQLIHSGCFLCDPNVYYQQRGLEIGYHLSIGDASYVAYVNPYPLMEMHVTVAALQHVAQGWIHGSVEESTFAFRQITRDLLGLVRELPGYLAYYSGPSAGASIPAHRHFHLIRREPGCTEFPLERRLRETGGQGVRPPDYPVSAMQFRGTHAQVLNDAAAWVERWLDCYTSAHGLTSLTSLTCNLIAKAEDGQLALIFVPRERRFAHAPGLAGAVGSLELLGEIVFCSADEKMRLDSGAIDYAWVQRALASVAVPVAVPEPLLQ